MTATASLGDASSPVVLDAIALMGTAGQRALDIRTLSDSIPWRASVRSADGTGAPVALRLD